MAAGIFPFAGCLAGGLVALFEQPDRAAMAVKACDITAGQVINISPGVIIIEDDWPCCIGAGHVLRARGHWPCTRQEQGQAQQRGQC